MMMELSKTDMNLSTLSSKQISLFDTPNLKDIEKLQELISTIKVIKSTTGVSSPLDSSQLERYSQALSDLEPKQAALLLSTQGLSNAQIRQTLQAQNLTTAQQYQAMSDAGLLKSKQELTNAELQSTLQSILNSEEKAKEAMTTMGLSVAIEGEEAQVVELTDKKIAELSATGKLTQELSEELAMRTGIDLAMQKQNTSAMPKWLAGIEATKKVVKEEVSATMSWVKSLSFASKALMGVGAVAGIAAIAYKKYKEHEEELRLAADQSAAAYQNTAATIDDYAGSYHSLYSQLLAANGNEQETFRLKQELLDLQTKLNDQFGAEYGYIDLTTDAYKNQTEAIKELQKASAAAFLVEHDEAIKTANDEMTRKRLYHLSSFFGVSDEAKDDQRLEDLISSYEGKGISLIQNKKKSVFSIVLRADAEDANETLLSFKRDLTNLALESEDRSLFDGILDASKKALEKNEKIIEEQGNIYYQAQEAEKMLADTKEETLANTTVSLETLNSQIDSIQSAYNSLAGAVDEYNQQGYLSIDTLQTLLTMDSAYLSCLMNENGQLVLNGATYEKLIQAKLADAEASAVQQAIDELGRVTTQSKTKADILSTEVTAKKAGVLSALAGSYGAVAQSAAAAAQSEALMTAYEEAANENKAETDKIMSALNTRLALIQSTASSTAGSFSSAGSQINRFSDASTNAASAADDLTSSIEKQKNALEKQKEALEKQKTALEEQKQHYDDVAEAINWFYDKQIDKTEDLIENLEKQNELLQEQIDGYDSALSAIDRFYEKEIDAIRSKIDAMDEANDAAEREIALEKARYALEAARNNKSVMQYQKGAGFIYTTDQSALRDAEENLKSAEKEKVKADLEFRIAQLEQYRDLWADIPNIKQKSEEDSMMIQILGTEWESLLLSGRLGTVTAFRDQYIALQTEINSNEGLIASYEEKIAYYESLKEEWDNLLSKYQEDTYTQLLIGEFGNNYESELLNGRTEKWKQFANDYYHIQEELKDVTDKIESLAKRMEEYAAQMERSANNAKRALSDLSNAQIPSGEKPAPYTSAADYAKSHGKAISFSTGGIISGRHKNSLDYLAKAHGEDHTIYVREGEAVIPEKTVNANQKIIQQLLAADGQELDQNLPGVNMDYYYRLNPAGISPRFTAAQKNLSHILSLGNTPGTILQFYGNLSFPNVHSGNDAQMLIKELSSLSSKAEQRAHKRF